MTCVSDQTCFVYRALFTVLCTLLCFMYCALAGTKKKGSGEGKAFIFRVGKGLVIRGVSLYQAFNLSSFVEN